MTSTSSIVSSIDAFVAAQNQNRVGALAGGGTLPLDYDALTGSVPAGGNAVTGIAGIASGAASINLPAGQSGNAVIVDGGISTAASTSGADSYSLAVSATGAVTLTDNNTGNSESISGASYFLFNGAATTSSGAYQSLDIIETGNNAVIAAMFNAAFQRVPDLPGLEFYIDQLGTPIMPDLHKVAVFLVGSPEMQKRYPSSQTAPDQGGPNDQAFVTALYGGILHRTPAATEVQFYEQALAGTLTTSSGQPIGAVDRPTVLEYFTTSPENQADIAASKGGWLINPANGAINLGTLTQASATAVLTSAVASGIVNLADFATISNTADQLTVLTYNSAGSVAGGVTIQGANTVIGGYKISGADVGSTSPDVTINLTSAINIASASGLGDVVNGAPTGGSNIAVADISPAPNNNNGGTVNLFANGNMIVTGDLGINQGSGTSVPTLIHGWNSTDSFRLGNAVNQTGTLYTASASSPFPGSSINWNAVYSGGGVILAINLGTVADDSVTTMLAKANSAYTVADATIENAYFLAQDPQGNTLVWHWNGDTTHVHQILAADINGAVELVGVQVSALIAANFQ